MLTIQIRVPSQLLQRNQLREGLLMNARDPVVTYGPENTTRSACNLHVTRLSADVLWLFGRLIRYNCAATFL